MGISVSNGSGGGMIKTGAMLGIGFTLGAILLKGSIKMIDNMTGNKIPAEYTAFRAQRYYRGY